MAATALLACLAGAGPGSAHQIGRIDRPGPPPPILRVTAETVRHQLFDAASGRPIADTDVLLSSDNGIRCIVPPCPTNAKTWRGRTDQSGRVDVPTAMLQAITRIETEAHASASLVENAEETQGTWELDLPPRSVLDAGIGAHAFKLVDAATNRPIADVPVRVIFGGDGTLDARTSPRGYLFIPMEKVVDFDRVLVAVAGYRQARLDFAAARFRTSLERD